MLLQIVNRCFKGQSKKAWFQNHINDEHVKKAKLQGYRSRASFKILQIEDKFSVLKKASAVLDLGCAPGSWSQAIQAISPNTKVVGVDLLPMRELSGVDFYNCDARNLQFQKILREKYGKFDALVSDMAPNFSGTLFETHEETVELNKYCLELNLTQCSSDASLVMKTVEGQMQKPLGWLLKYFFSQVTRFKPKSSRSQSAQHYLVCKGKRNFQEIQRMVGKFREINIQKIVRKDDIPKFFMDEEV